MYVDVEPVSVLVSTGSGSSYRAGTSDAGSNAGPFTGCGGGAGTSLIAVCDVGSDESVALAMSTPTPKQTATITAAPMTNRDAPPFGIARRIVEARGSR